MPLLVLLPGPGAAADCIANPPAVIIFEVTDEPDGVRWTVAQGGWSGTSNDVSVTGGAVNLGIMEENQGPPLAIEAGGGDGRFYAAFSNPATDTSGFVPLSTGGFQATLLEGWSGFASSFCLEQGDSMLGSQLLRLTSDGERFFNTANQSGGCWATGASALFSGSFAEHGILPGVESSFKVCREEDPFEIRIHTLATSSLTVVVDAAPADGADFGFTAQRAGDATGTPLTLDDAVPDDGDGVAASMAVPGVIADTWEVAQMVPPGWNLEGATCTGGADAGSLAPGTQPATLTVDVAAREDVVCTFSLTKKGSVTIVHDATPDDTQDFTFAGDLGTFTLDDDADPTWPDSITVADLVASTYAVSAAVPSGWTLEDIVCDDPGAVPDVTGASVAILLDDPGEHVTCIFESTRHATLEIVQSTLPQQAQDFTFAGDLGPFALDDDGDPTLADSASFSVLPGRYQVTQAGVPGFDLQSILCSDDDSDGDVGSATATFEAAAGESVTCTFENHQRGSVTLEVVATPEGPQDFTLTGDLGTFTLDDDGGADPTQSDSVTVTDVAPGSHTMTQAVPDPWDLSIIQCDDNDSTGDTTSGTVVLEVAPGEHVTCTFHNTQRATLEIVQSTLPQQAQDFTFTGDLGPFAIDDDADPTLADAASFSVLPGRYQVTQAGVPGFDLRSILCSDGDSGGDLGSATATFEAAPGESITCTFENHQRGSVTLEVAATPEGPQDFTLTGDLGTFTLDDDGGADPTHSDSVTVTDVATGAHTMELLVPAGWSLSTLACDDADSAGHPSAATVDLAIDPAEDVHCTFELESAETDLGLTKHLLEGGGSATVDFLLVVTNHGPAPGTGVMVVDALPDGLVYQGNDCGAAFSTGPPETLTWSLATLQVGETASCILTATNQLTEPVVNEATIEMDQQDPAPGNDVGSAPVGPLAIAIPTGTAPGLLLLVIALGAAGTLAARREL